MKVLHLLRNPFYGLLGVLFLLLHAYPASAGQTACDDVASNGRLNILTINLLFSEIETRDARLASIAEFVAVNRVDVLLLQEVVGGELVSTDNSARDLQEILAANHGLAFDLKTAFEAGVPGVLATANAVLSRCEILFQLVKFLPLTSESIEIGDLVIPITRNVMMVRLRVPGFGRLNVYNTHLCAGACTVGELGTQVEAVLGFANIVERFFSFFRGRPHILGGDFNLDNFRGGPNSNSDPFGPEKPLYDTIIGQGFIDAYAKAVEPEPLTGLCEDPGNADVHCTVGVSELNGRNARRIDYIFARRFGAVEAGEVVFNPGVAGGVGPTVSDHAAVFVSVSLPRLLVGLK